MVYQEIKSQLAKVLSYNIYTPYSPRSVQIPHRMRTGSKRTNSRPRANSWHQIGFWPHVDEAMAKANRLLGLLMRSMQLACYRCYIQSERKVIIAAYYAHIRSVIEYASVTWSGAAMTHLMRFERLQHHFLMWLACNTVNHCPPLDFV